MLLYAAVGIVLSAGVEWSAPLSVARNMGDAATVAALETQVAVLSTKVALQTTVANLEGQLPLAGSTTSQAPGDELLYKADWSEGFGDWAGGLSW